MTAGRLVLEYRLSDGRTVAQADLPLPFEPDRHDGDASPVQELFEVAGQDLAFRVLRDLKS